MAALAGEVTAALRCAVAVLLRFTFKA